VDYGRQAGRYGSIRRQRQLAHFEGAERFGVDIFGKE